MNNTFTFQNYSNFFGGHFELCLPIVLVNFHSVHCHSLNVYVNAIIILCLVAF